MAIHFPVQQITSSRAPLPLLAILNFGMLALIASPPDLAAPSLLNPELARIQSVARSVAGPGGAVEMLDASPNSFSWEPVVATPESAATPVAALTQPIRAESVMPAETLVRPVPQRTPQPVIEPPAASVVNAARPQPQVEAPAPAVVAVPSSVPQAPSPVSGSTREMGLLSAMNAARVAAGLAPLQLNGSLTTAARSRTHDMELNNYFAHVSPSGDSWYTALANVGWSISGGGENLAKVGGDETSSVTVAMNALMASPTHRANILNPAWRLVGVGAETSAAGITIFTTIFADH